VRLQRRRYRALRQEQGARPVPGGVRALERHLWEFSQPREALRVVSAAMEALRRMGAELAMVIAMHWGMNATLLSGAAAYLGAALLLPTLLPRTA
jgi:hypothetical protein